MEVLIKQIDQILAEWDPIGVGKGNAADEYSGYIPVIIKSIGNKKTLINCLISILVNDMGLDYDPFNQLQVDDLEQVCENIIEAASS